MHGEGPAASRGHSAARLCGARATARSVRLPDPPPLGRGDHGAAFALQAIEPRAHARQLALARTFDLGDQAPRCPAELDRRLQRGLAELVVAPRDACLVVREYKRVEALADPREFGERSAAINLGDESAERGALPVLPRIERAALGAPR